MTDETIWTSRRALLLVERRWAPGRLRISDAEVRFTGLDGTVVSVPRSALQGVRLARAPRRALVLETPEGPLRLRCFAMPAVLGLLLVP